LEVPPEQRGVARGGCRWCRRLLRSGEARGGGGGGWGATLGRRRCAGLPRGRTLGAWWAVALCAWLCWLWVRRKVWACTPRPPAVCLVSKHSKQKAKKYSHIFYAKILLTGAGAGKVTRNFPT